MVRDYARNEGQPTDKHLAFFARKMVRENKINGFTEREITKIVNDALSAEDAGAWYRTPMTTSTFEPMIQVDIKDIPY